MNNDELIERLGNLHFDRESSAIAADDAIDALRELQAERDAAREALTLHLDALGQVVAERDAALREVEEQARLLSMGSEREARLMAERDEMQKQIDALQQRVHLVSGYDALKAALDWYLPNLEDCNRHGTEGDFARQKLANDRGMRAREALTGKEAG